MFWDFCDTPKDFIYAGRGELQMRNRISALLMAVCISTSAYAGDVQTEADQFLSHLKRFCIDGGLSVEAAEQQWAAAGASRDFTDKFVSNNRAELEGDYDQMLITPGLMERLKTKGPAREEYIKSRLRPDHVFYYGTSLFNSAIGPQHYTLSAEKSPTSLTFYRCGLHSSFSSVSEALARIEGVLSLKGRQYQRGGQIYWLDDAYPNLKFGAVVTDPSSNAPGDFIIEVHPNE